MNGQEALMISLRCICLTKKERVLKKNMSVEEEEQQRLHHQQLRQQLTSGST
jgi:hypothetical protein